MLQQHVNLTSYTIKQSHIHILSKQAVKDFKNLEMNFKIVFDKYKYKYLFKKNKLIDQKNLIKIINAYLKNIDQLDGLPYTIKSY